MNERSREDFLEPSPSSNGTLIMLSLASLEPMVLFPIVDPALAVGQPSLGFPSYLLLLSTVYLPQFHAALAVFSLKYWTLYFSLVYFILSHSIPNDSFCPKTVVPEKSSCLWDWVAEITRL